MEAKTLDRGYGEENAVLRLSRGFGGRRLGLSVACDLRTARQLRPAARFLARIAANRALLLAVAALLFALLLWQRCPSILSLPSFWGEDGWVWYPQCYVHGWRCLLIDHTGYLQTISMLSALVAQPFPLLHAPKLFALIALAAQAAPAIFLASWRMAEAIPRLSVRLLLAVLLLSAPGMSEVYVNVTNAQWQLALLCFLVVTAAAPAGWMGRGFDTVVLVIGGLSGPFSVFLAPVALLWWVVQRGRWAFWRLLLVFGAAGVQGSLILLHQASRTSSHGPGLGISLRSFDTILLNTILGPATLGWQAMRRNGWLDGHGSWLFGPSGAALVVSTLLVMGAALLTGIAAWRGRWVLRCFLLFVLLEFLATLIEGLPINALPLWQELAPAVADRYSFHPILAWLAILVSLTLDPAPPLRAVGSVLLACSLIFAVAGDWALAPLPPTDFQAKARIFAQSPSGTVMQFQTRPMFFMTLTKK
ncbi:MAG TPA: hypothetical protein VL752_09555 [Acidisoma sp.]|uniref:hypothetical protein n=1 Tax=Acidisoma sp. TaxID=1872115 RepID=UPI002C305839|nr:hypothetical protein [Acidisoma sp.]HTI01178.1 hypothetical protein [Acidisoma sp.]